MDLGETTLSLCSFHAKIFLRSRHGGNNLPDEKSPSQRISYLEKGGILGDRCFKASHWTNRAVFPAKKLSYKTVHFLLNSIFSVFLGSQLILGSRYLPVSCFHYRFGRSFGRGPQDHLSKYPFPETAGRDDKAVRKKPDSPLVSSFAAREGQGSLSVVTGGATEPV